MQRCKTCGREYSALQTMTYSEYGYCSWDCLMNKRSQQSNRNKVNRRNNAQKHYSGHRAKWA